MTSGTGRSAGRRSKNRTRNWADGGHSHSVRSKNQPASGLTFLRISRSLVPKASPIRMLIGLEANDRVKHLMPGVWRDTQIESILRKTNSP